MTGDKSDNDAESTDSITGLLNDEPASEDAIGFDAYTNALASFLLAEDTESPLTISIEGPWGIGKSSFMQQLRKRLSTEGAVTIEFNAWSHESTEDLWSGFLTSFITQVSRDRNRWLGRYRSMFQLYFARFRAGDGRASILLRLFATIVLSLMLLLIIVASLDISTGTTTVFGLNEQASNIIVGGGSISVIITALISVGAVLRKRVWTPLHEQGTAAVTGPDNNVSKSFRAAAVDDFERVVDAYLGDETAYVFVDDLDRMEVPKAAKLLREINLYLSKTDQIIFIFGMDREKVAAGLAASNESILPFLNEVQYENEDIDTEETNESATGIEFGLHYLEKFVQVPIRVPRLDTTSVSPLLTQVNSSKNELTSVGSLEVLASEKLIDLDSKAESWQKLMTVISRLLENNPRKIKTFGNLYRLYGFLAVQEGMFDRDDPLTSPQLAKYVGLSIQYPQLITRLINHPEIVTDLEDYALGELSKEDVDPRCEPWVYDRDIRELLKHEGDAEIGTSTLRPSVLQQLSQVAPTDDTESKGFTQTFGEKSEENLFDWSNENISKSERQLLRTLQTKQELEEEFEVSPGIRAYAPNRDQNESVINNREYHASKKISEEYYPLIRGEEITPYTLSREDGEWIRYGKWLADPREKRFFTEPRVIARQALSLQNGILAGYSDKELVYNRSGIGILPRDQHVNKAKILTGILNSSLIRFYILRLSSVDTEFPMLPISKCRKIPIPEEVTSEDLVELVEKRRSLQETRSDLNVELTDYLGGYADGPTLADLSNGPALANEESILHETSETREGLRIAGVGVERNDDEVTILLTARYRPKNESNYETDQYGYTQTSMLPALTYSELDPEIADLIEVFVPIVVEEGSGFAEFRETASKSTSLIDRLKELTLPKLDDVREDVKNYQQAVKEDEKLSHEIAQIDQEIDSRVYELYDLSNDQIEVIEDNMPA